MRKATHQASVVGTETEVINRLGKDEMNLAEFPVTLLADRSPSGVNLIRYQDQIFDTSLNRTIDRKLTITAPDEYGLPTAIDDDVLLALIQITNNYNGFTSREVKFTRYELVEMLKWSQGGNSYKRITASLRRWTSAYLDYENAWWDKHSQRWITRGFHILDNFELNESKSNGGQAELFQSSITWNKVIFESFQAGYLKSIDYDLYMRFQNQVSKRLYRFLSKRFYRGDQILNLRDLAFEHVGLSRTYSDTGKIKEKLQPAIEELESVGFLHPMKREDRYQKTGRAWTIRLVEGKKRPSVTISAAVVIPEQEIDPNASALIEELVKRGVSRNTATQIVGRYLHDSITLKIECFDWMLGQKDKRVTKSPAGYLVKSIEDDYSVPKGFISKTEQEQLAKTAKELRQKQRLEANEKAKRQAEEEKEQRDLEGKADAYLASLPEAEREDLEKEALKETGADGRFFRKELIREYVIKTVDL